MRRSPLLLEMYLAAVYRPELRPVARRWFTDMVELMAAYLPAPAPIPA